MKIQSHPSKTEKGFTLVELLVVISIIAILSTFGVKAGRGAIIQAKKVKSQADCMSLVGALQGFYNEYSVYPAVNSNTVVLSVKGGDTAVALDGTTDGKALMEALMGLEPATTPTPRNPKNITFLTGEQAKASSRGINWQSGINSTGAAPGFEFADSWSNPYYVIWDADYDGIIADPLRRTTDEVRKSIGAVGQGAFGDFTTDAFGAPLDTEYLRHAVSTL